MSYIGKRVILPIFPPIKSALIQVAPPVSNHFLPLWVYTIVMNHDAQLSTVHKLSRGQAASCGQKKSVMHRQTVADAAAESEEHVSFQEQIIRFKYGSDTAKDCEVVGKIKV
jgi:hypothetical protein